LSDAFLMMTRLRCREKVEIGGIEMGKSFQVDQMTGLKMQMFLREQQRRKVPKQISGLLRFESDENSNRVKIPFLSIDAITIINSNNLPSLTARDAHPLCLDTRASHRTFINIPPPSSSSSCLLSYSFFNELIYYRRWTLSVSNEFLLACLLAR
jgi:hypothetical protein